MLFLSIFSLTLNRLWARTYARQFCSYIYLVFYPTYLYSFFLIDSSLVRNTQGAMSLSEDNQIRIPKLKKIENYCSWVICIQVALKSRNIWEIVIETKVIPTISVKSVSQKLKDDYVSFFKNKPCLKAILS